MKNLDTINGIFPVFASITKYGRLSLVLWLRCREKGNNWRPLFPDRMQNTPLKPGFVRLKSVTWCMDCKYGFFTAEQIPGAMSAQKGDYLCGYLDGAIVALETYMLPWEFWSFAEYRPMIRNEVIKYAGSNLRVGDILLKARVPIPEVGSTPDLTTLVHRITDKNGTYPEFFWESLGGQAEWMQLPNGKQVIGIPCCQKWTYLSREGEKAEYQRYASESHRCEVVGSTKSTHEGFMLREMIGCGLPVAVVRQEDILESKNNATLWQKSVCVPIAPCKG